jgi:hypothetical protein
MQIKTLLDQITEKLGVIDYSEISTLLFSITLLLSKFGFDVSYKLRNLIVNKFPDKIELDKKGDIPTLCFSMTSLTESELEITE